MRDTHPLYSIIEAYNNAWNRHDIKAILALHTEDSVFCNHTSGGEAVGREAIQQIITRVFETFPHIHFDLRRLYVRDDLIVQEWTAPQHTAIQLHTTRNLCLSSSSWGLQFDIMPSIISLNLFS